MLWDELEQELGLRNALRTCWEESCAVIRASGSEPEVLSAVDAEGLDRALASDCPHDVCTLTPEGRWECCDSLAKATTLDDICSEGGWSVRFSMGHLVSAGLHRHLSQVQSLMKGHNVGSNVYVTPSGQRCGFSRHTDPQNIFVTQVSGEKTWHISHHGELPLAGETDLPLADEANLPHIESPPFELPASTARSESVVVPKGGVKRKRRVGGSSRVSKRLRGKSADERITFFKEGIVTLHRGDRLYLPRGFAHRCVTSSASSVHLTVDTSIHCQYAVLVSGVAALAECDVSSWEPSIEARRSLPFGWLWMVGSLYQFPEFSAHLLAVVLTEIGSFLSVKHREHAALLAMLARAADAMADDYFQAAIPSQVPHNLWRVSHLHGQPYIQLLALPPICRNDLSLPERAGKVTVPASWLPLLLRLVSSDDQPHLSCQGLLSKRTADPISGQNYVLDSLRSTLIELGLEV